MVYKFSILLFFSFIYSAPSFAQEQEAGFRQVIAKAQNEPHFVARQTEESQRLVWEQKILDQNRSEQKLNGLVGNSRNEVADSYDLSAAATDTNRFKVGYTQTFESGMNWSVTHFQRTSKALNTQASSEEFTKDLVSLSYPWSGPDHNKLASSNRLQKNKLTQRQRRQSETNTDQQLKAGLLYLELCRAETKRDHRLTSNRMLTKLLVLKRSGRLRGQGSDRRTLKITEYQASSELKRLNRQVARIQGKLSGLTDLDVTSGVDCAALAPPTFDPEQLVTDYQATKLKQSGIEEQQLKLTLELERYNEDHAPELLTHAFVGSSKAGATSGSNLGVALEVNYAFGGSRDQKIKLSTLEIQFLEAEKTRLAQEAGEEAKYDLDTLAGLEEEIITQQELYQLSKAQITALSRRLPKSPLAELPILERKRDLLKIHLAQDLARLDTVETSFRIWAAAGKDFSQFPLVNAPLEGETDEN